MYVYIYRCLECLRGEEQQSQRKRQRQRQGQTQRQKRTSYACGVRNCAGTSSCHSVKQVRRKGKQNICSASIQCQCLFEIFVFNQLLEEAQALATA